MRLISFDMAFMDGSIRELMIARALGVSGRSRPHLDLTSLSIGCLPNRVGIRSMLMHGSTRRSPNTFYVGQSSVTLVGSLLLHPRGKPDGVIRLQQICWPCSMLMSRIRLDCGWNLILLWRSATFSEIWTLFVGGCRVFGVQWDTWWAKRLWFSLTRLERLTRLLISSPRDMILGFGEGSALTFLFCWCILICIFSTFIFCCYV